jgi:glycerol kinase
MVNVAQIKTEMPLILALDAASNTIHASLNDGTAKLINDLKVKANSQFEATPDGGVEKSPNQLIQSLYQSKNMAMALKKISKQPALLLKAVSFSPITFGVNGGLENAQIEAGVNFVSHQ